MTNQGSRSVGMSAHQLVKGGHKEKPSVQVGDTKLAASTADPQIDVSSMHERDHTLAVHRHQRTLSNASQGSQREESLPLAERMMPSKAVSEPSSKLQEQLMITLKHQLRNILKHKRKPAEVKSMEPDTAARSEELASKHTHPEPSFTQEELQAVYDYFLKEDKDVREGSPLLNMAKLFSFLTIPESAAERHQFFTALETFTNKMLKLAFEQHLHNPEHFVSHGFDHSVNVAEYTNQMLGPIVEGASGLENDPSAVEQSKPEVGDPRIVAATMTRYGITQGEARFALQIVALLHDCGYPCLHERTKCVHGISGADLVYRMREEFKTLITSSSEHKERLFQDLVSAIMYHSADRKDQSYEGKIETTVGSFLIDPKNLYQVLCSFYDQSKNEAKVMREPVRILVQKTSEIEEIEYELRRAQAYAKEHFGLRDDQFVPVEIVQVEEKFIGRVADLDKSGDKLIGLEFSETNLLETPFDIVRLADNMDMAYSRMTPLQRDPIFREFYHLLGGTTDEYKVTSQLESLEAQARRLKNEPDAVKPLVERAYRVLSTQGQDFLSEARKRDLPPSFDTALKVRRYFNKGVLERLLQEQKAEVPLELASKILRVGKLLSSYDLRHFGGCEAIKGIDLLVKEGIPILLVKVDGTLYRRLNEVEVQEKTILEDQQTEVTVKVGVGEYQVWRALEAFRSIKVGETKVSLVIQDENDTSQSFPVPGVRA